VSVEVNGRALLDADRHFSTLTARFIMADEDGRIVRPGPFLKRTEVETRHRTFRLMKTVTAHLANCFMWQDDHEMGWQPLDP